MKNVFYYDTPLGRMGIASMGEYVTDVFFARGDSFSPAVCRQTPVIRVRRAAKYSPNCR